MSEKTELSPRKIAALVYQHRGAKEVLPAEQIRERQLARLTPSERRQLVTLKEQAAERQDMRQRQGLSIYDHVEFEPETQRHKWSYGEQLERQKMGYG